MLLLIDENVPQSVADFFVQRGHEVKYVRDLFPGGTADPVIATIGDRLSAIVVTWDHDFRSIASRVPKGNVNKIRNLGRISFSCKYEEGRAQLERWIKAVELHYELAQTRDDVRMIVEIQGNAIKAW
jgi:predicted nuclease of predicted toxin-antitoxin system